MSLHSILLVDDDVVSRTTLNEILALDASWRIDQAPDGQDAWDLMVAGYRPDLIITDLRMPKLSGDQFIERIRSAHTLRNLPILVISGVRDRQTITGLAHLHITGYLLKPFDPARVLTVVQHALKVVHPVPPVPPRAGITLPPAAKTA